MALELTGKVVHKLAEKTGEGKNGTWRQGSFVIEYGGNDYPKNASFLVWGDELSDKVKTLKAGQQVKVTFSPESREYNERWYTDNKCYKLEIIGAVTNQPVIPPPAPPPAEEEDDLPF